MLKRLALGSLWVLAVLLTACGGVEVQLAGSPTAEATTVPGETVPAPPTPFPTPDEVAPAYPSPSFHGRS